jgi:hypothetical protein
MKFFLSLTLSLLVSGCATSIPLTSSDPGLYTIPTGSILKLNQPLTIPALSVRTSIQGGEASAYVDPSEPYCEIEVNTILETSKTLPAGDYKITRVLRYEFPFSSVKPNSKMMVASTSEAAAWETVAMFSANSIWHYTTAFRLESNLYPDVRQLECGTVFDEGYFARHITIREFEILAGDVMSLQPVGK